MGISVFLKNGNKLGFKPSVSFSSIQMSFPIIVARGSSFAGMPLKLIFGLFSLAGLLFYSWSEETEKDNSEKSLERYKETCSLWNSARKETAIQSSRKLVLLAAIGWDSTLKQNEKSIQSKMDHLLANLKRKKTSQERSNFAKAEIFEKNDTLFDLTEELGTSIIMDSISVKMDDGSLNFAASLPRISAANHVSMVVVSELDRCLKWEVFNNHVLIGRGQ